MVYECNNGSSEELKPLNIFNHDDQVGLATAFYPRVITVQQSGTINIDNTSIRASGNSNLECVCYFINTITKGKYTKICIDYECKGSQLSWSGAQIWLVKPTALSDNVKSLTYGWLYGDDNSHYLSNRELTNGLPTSRRTIEYNLPASWNEKTEFCLAFRDCQAGTNIYKLWLE